AFPGQLRTNLRKAGTQIEPLPVYLVTNQAVGGENLFPFHRIAGSGKDRIPVEGFLLTWVSPIACKQRFHTLIHAGPRSLGQALHHWRNELFGNLIFLDQVKYPVFSFVIASEHFRCKSSQRVGMPWRQHHFLNDIQRFIVPTSPMVRSIFIALSWSGPLTSWRSFSSPAKEIYRRHASAATASPGLEEISSSRRSVSLFTWYCFTRPM